MRQSLGVAAMLLLAVTGCSTNQHMLEPGHDKRADVSPEVPVHRHLSPAYPASGSLIDDSDAPCTYSSRPADDVVESLAGEDGFDATPDRDVRP